MSKIFVKRFKSFLMHRMQKSKLHAEVGLIDVSVNYFNLFRNEIIGVSSCDITNDVYLREMESFTIRGSGTIKKTSGYHMQDVYNENSKYLRSKIKYSGHVYRFIRTETTKNGYVEIILSSKNYLGSDYHKALAVVLFKEILTVFYPEVDKIKKQYIGNIDTYIEKYKADSKSDLIYNDNCNIDDIPVSWQIDEFNKLNCKHLQVLISLMHNYNNSEMAAFFNITKEAKFVLLKQIRSRFGLENKATHSEIMKRAKTLDILPTLEVILQS